MRSLCLTAGVLLTIASCVSAAPQDSRPARGVARSFGPAPESPTGPYREDVAAAVATLLDGGLNRWIRDKDRAIETLAASGDPRVGWIFSDMLRVVRDYGLAQRLKKATGELLGLESDRSWLSITDHLMAWDVPAPPGYLDAKRGTYLTVEPRWDRLLVEGDVDWRFVSWGGVLIDDRPYGETDEPCNCIPAADNPKTSSAAEAEWLTDDAVVFGIEVGGEARAYPRRIMEVREMVNDRLGGRQLGIPYCTLCGAAQAFFTDRQPEGVDRIVLRTSGLLSRSNKLMFDLTTWSAFDTFLGKALTGPLAKRGVVLEQAGVVTTTWKAWREAHPDTTVLVEDLALGRDFDFRNGRDANGPIFPVGGVDPRLPIQADVVGVLTASGKPVAFHVESALAALRRGESVAFENVRLKAAGGGVLAVDAEGNDLGGHQAFWFAWSQFHPDTMVWPE